MPSKVSDILFQPNRTYYLEDKKLGSQEWVQKVTEVWKRYYGDNKQIDGSKNG